MKRLLILFLIVTCFISLIACQNENTTGQNKKTNSFCYQCGAELHADFIYCSNCGKKVAKDTIETPQENNNWNSDTNSTSKDTVPKTCVKNGCSYATTDNSNYCSNHKCWDVYCENASKSTSSYCVEHACAKSGCGFQKSLMSNYCLTHTCSSANCDNEVSNNSNYCIEHKCQKSGCSSGKKFNSDYCFLHSN